MYIVIITDVLDDGSPLTINVDNEYPAMFDSIADIQELKEKDYHSLGACDWWAFDCSTGQTTLLD